MPPPDHKFWIRKVSNLKRTHPNPMSFDEGGSLFKSEVANQDMLIRKTSRTLFPSFNRTHLGIEKRVIFKNSESIASFGSMIFTPAMKKKSSDLLVVERLSVV